MHSARAPTQRIFIVPFHVYKGKDNDIIFLFHTTAKGKITIKILPELVFLNLYGAQESMPRHQSRQPM
jgi:hypothetical protein